MGELAELDLKKVAVKMAPKVGSVLGELSPKQLAEGDLASWRDSRNSTWGCCRFSSTETLPF